MKEPQESSISVQSQSLKNYLTHFVPVLPSYRNQSIVRLVSIWGQHWYLMG